MSGHISTDRPQSSDGGSRANDEALEVLERLVGAMGTNDPHAVARLYAEDCQIADPAMFTSGRDGLLEAVGYFFSAFRVRSIEVEQTIIDGARLAVLWRWTVIHHGEYLGVPPSGREFATWNVMLLELRDGLICRDTSVWDAGELLRLQSLAEPNPNSGAEQPRRVNTRGEEAKRK